MFPALGPFFRGDSETNVSTVQGVSRITGVWKLPDEGMAGRHGLFGPKKERNWRQVTAVSTRRTIVC